MAKKSAKPRVPREIEIKALDPAHFLKFDPPLSPSAIVGQERAIKVMNDSLRGGRIHHAWIFHGPQGVGKFTAALTFASLLLDPTTQATFSGDFEPDPASTTQRLLAAGSHPDLSIIVKELGAFHPNAEVRKQKHTGIGIDVIREFLLNPAAIAPSIRSAAAAGKVFIIDEAELMKGPAQSAVLKVLEEPPAGVIIILVTTAEESLLPTIRSRSQRIYFPPLSHQNMHAWLTASRESLVTLRSPDTSGEQAADDSPLALADGPGAGNSSAISADEEKFLLEFASGSPGAFSQAYERGIYVWWKQLGSLLVAAEKGQFGIDLGPAFAKLVDDLAEKLVSEGDNASKDAANKEAAGWMFRLVGNYLHRRLREAARSTKASAATLPYLTMLDRLQDAESELAANVAATIVFDKLAAELAAAAAG